MAVLLATNPNDAGAAALGSVATSVGLFATLVALLAIQGWAAAWSPAQIPPVLVAALFVACAAGWIWHARRRGRRSMPRVMLFESVRDAHAASAERTWRPTRPKRVQLPARLEQAPLLNELKRNFVRLQSAWDLGEMETLRRLTTPEMLEELCRERADGGPTSPVADTGVVTLHAELLGFEVLQGAEVLSVEFSGLLREAAEDGAVPFRELWMLARTPRTGNAEDWKLARHQVLL